MTTIEQNVMRRVHRIHMLRHLLDATALKAYVIVVGFALLGQFVHVASVFSNMPDVMSPGAFVGFWTRAVLGAEHVVQLVLVVVLVAVFMLARDMLRGDYHLGSSSVMVS